MDGGFLARVKRHQRTPRVFMLGAGHSKRNNSMSVDSFCLAPPPGSAVARAWVSAMRTVAAAVPGHGAGSGAELGLGLVAHEAMAAARAAGHGATFAGVVDWTLALPGAVGTPPALLEPICARAIVVPSLAAIDSPHGPELAMNITRQHAAWSEVAARPCSSTFIATDNTGLTASLPVYTRYVVAECAQPPSQVELEQLGVPARAVGTVDPGDGEPIEPSVCQLAHGAQYAHVSGARRLVRIERGGEREDVNAPSLSRSELFTREVLLEVANRGESA